MAQRKGLCDFHIAPVTKDDSSTYETGNIIKLMKAATAKTKLTYTSEEVYFDDVVDDIDQNYEGGDMELEGDYLTADVIQIIKGHMNNSGMSVVKTDDSANDVAVLFRSKMSNNKYKFYCYYSVNFGNEEEEDFETIGKKGKRQNTKLKGNIMARKKDNCIMVSVTEDEMKAAGVENPKAMLDTWFTKVPEPEDVIQLKKVAQQNIQSVSQ